MRLNKLWVRILVLNVDKNIMDPLEKKRLANERRLKAIQEQKQRKQQNGIIKPAKINIELTAKSGKKNNLKLFDSDGEDNNNDDMFKIRPQFEGQNGLQLLEMSSEFSSRFKLDERFKDDEPPEATDADASGEKVKNIKILESILGYEVSEKYPDGKSTSNKRQIERFDPEDEGTSKYLKTIDVSEESKIKPRKKNKGKEMDESEEIIPVSKERYIEVSSNLKDLFSSSSSFSLTSKFQSNDDQEENKMFELNNPFRKANPSAQKEQLSNKRVKEFKQNKYEAPQKTRDVIFESRSAYTFFITGDDSRLKEGVDFFMRPKPLDEIREDWNNAKDRVKELFRMKKRTHARGFVNKRPTTQGKRTFIKK